MNIKSIVLKTLLTGAACSLSLSTLASEPQFKVAVIKDFKGSEEIISGDFTKSIASLTKGYNTQEKFEVSMGLCAAYIKTNNIEKTESACTSAINSSKYISSNSKHAAYLKSVSYSNRGVARYLKDDISGAIDDLTTAILIDDNAIVKSNLRLTKEYLEDVQEIDSEISAD